MMFRFPTGVYPALLLGVSPALLFGARPALADTPAPMAIDDQNKAFSSGRAVIVATAQSEIGAEVDIGRVISDAAYGGGLIGGIINMAKDNKRELLIKIAKDKADAEVAPLRQSMTGFDFDARASASAQSALSHVDWFHHADLKTVRTTLPIDLIAIGKDAATRQYATLVYGYGLSPDFTQIRVIAEVTVSKQPDAHKNEAPRPPETLFTQRIAVIAELKTRSYDHAQNVALWNADNGRLAKTSIETALSHLERLVPYAMNQSAAAVGTLQAAKAGKVFAAGLYGPAVNALPPDPDETVLWKRGIIDVFEVSGTGAVAVR